MRQFLLFLLTAISFSVFSQNTDDFDLTWGPKCDSFFGDKYFYVDDQSFYTDSWGYQNYEAFRYLKDGVLISETLYKSKVNGKDAAYPIGTYLNNGKLQVYTVDATKTTQSLYLHEINSNVKKVDAEGKKIVSFEYNKKTSDRAGFIVFRSKDERKTCAVYYSQSEKSENVDQNIFGYYILDENHGIISQGSFSKILEKKDERLLKYVLTNSGELLISSVLYDLSGLTTIKFYKVAVNHEIKVVETQIQNKYLKNIAFLENGEGDYVVSSFYGDLAGKGENNGTATIGVFFMIIDSKVENILSTGLNEFDQEFIMEGLTASEKSKAEKELKEKNQKYSLHNLYHRSLQITADGGYFGVAEEIFAKENINNLTVYDHDNIILYKLDRDGNLDWTKKIQKKQVSSETGAISSSFAMLTSPEKVFFVFNDSEKNYDKKSNKFIENKNVETIVQTNNRVVAYTLVELGSGDISRSMLWTADEDYYKWFPKNCINSKNEDGMLILAGNKKDGTRIGKITLK